MARFQITNESTEDTVDSTESLQEAIRMATDAAKKGPVGDPVSVECDGRAIRQFVLSSDGIVVEQRVA